MDIQSANKQHPVPQNVMDVEFKLIGELTIRQFSYLLVFTIVTFVVAKTGLPIIFKYPLIFGLVLSGLAFAFLPLNDITLDKWVANYIKAVTTPRLRVWKHVQRVPYYFTIDAKHTDNKNEVKQVYNQKRGSIDDFLNKNKPTNVSFDDETDIAEKEAQFFAQVGLKPPQKSAQKTNISPNTDNQKPTPVQPESQVLTSKDILEDEAHTKGTYTSLALDKNNQTTAPTNTPMYQSNNQVSQKQEQTPQPTQTSVNDYKQHLKELETLKQKLMKDIEKNKFRVMEDKKQEVANLKNPEQQKREPIIIKPDFTEKIEKQASDTQETIKAPIRKDVEKQPRVQKPTIKETPPVQVTNQSAQPKTSVFKNLFGMLNTTPDVKVEQKTINEEIKENLVKDLSVKPNMLKGSTQDMHGNLIPDTIVIIKNTDNDPVRALKTNKLGQFEISTPLENGEYVIEAIKEGFSFTPFRLNALGEQINPVKLVGTQNTVLS